MSVLTSSLDKRGESYAENRRHMQELVDDLRSTLSHIELGGDERSRKRHEARGKLLPRERVRRLLDPGSPFLELSPLAAHGVYDTEVPASGILTGVGRVSGRDFRSSSPCLSPSWRAVHLTSRKWIPSTTLISIASWANGT